MRPVFRALFTAALGCLVAAAATAESRQVTTYRSPSCGCCKKWAAHMEQAGFSVEMRDVRDLDRVKSAYRVPRELSACHTAIVDGYVVEGHVPAEDVVRMLADRPPILGLAVPGMPEGSPGMEGPHPERYQVKSFDGAGRIEVFATHGP